MLNSNLMPAEPDTSELQWFVGADVPPADLQRTLKVIDQFLATPINLDGKKASELLTKTHRTRRARSPSPDSDGDPSDGAENSDSDAPKKRKKRKEKEPPKQPEFKSAQFIEDSDEEYGDIDAFLEKEKEMRERAVREAAETGKNPTMKATGTKKRRKKDAPAGEATAKRKKKRRSTSAAPDGDGDAESDADVFGSRPVGNVEESTSTPRPRPRPKPKARFRPKNSEGGTSSPETLPKSSEMDEDIPDALPDASRLPDAAPAVQPDTGSSDEETMGALSRRKKNRLVISDDED
jgi:replication fork protection complex subunit Tof1/Swi1